MRNRYIGRTFIEPTQRLRKLGARMKYNPLPEVVSGKRLVLLDDTIVRGTTQEQLVAMLREDRRSDRGPRAHHRAAGALALLPGHRHPRARRAHRPRRSTWRASASASVPTASSSSSPDNLVAAIDSDADQLCLGCFTREYPIDVQLPLDKFVLERPEWMQTTMVFPRDAGLDRRGEGGRSRQMTTEVASA